ncbi:MAG: Hsp20/alpha crystallin family protein, partial [Planctomycetota bacterium]
MNPRSPFLSAKALDDRDVFRQFLDDFHALRRGLRGRYRDVWRPPTDVYETEEDIVIKMSIPGIQRNEVTVECNGDVITICGVRKGVGSQGVRR